MVRTLLVLVVGALAAGCVGRAARGTWRAMPKLTEEQIGAATLPPPPAPDQIEGTPPIRVTWEALGREAYQMLHPTRPIVTGLKVAPPELKIVLLNASHPEAVKRRLRARENRSARFEAEGAIVGDADMNALLDDFEKLHVFDYARPTDAVESQFSIAEARGRITIEREGRSVTLFSRYGLGRNPETRPIQGIYSDAKKLIAVLKNRTPNLSVTNFKTSHPRKPDAK